MDNLPAVAGGNIPDLVRFSVAGQLMDSSKELYRRDMIVFDTWMTLRNVSLATMDYDLLVEYRAYLVTKYAKATATRMLTVARRVLTEAYHRGILAVNPAMRVKGFTLDNESPRTALNQEQCEKMLKAIDRATPKGKRDFALLELMIRTGIRRSEIVALKVGDIGMDAGYYTLTIRHGKGDKRRIAKLVVPLYMAIQDYLVARNGDVTPDAALFVGIDKMGRWNDRPLHMYGGLNYILQHRAKAIGIDLTPHDLRATFITLALEANAPLHKVQYAAGHSDPRTTERYHRRKQNLAENATDFIKFSFDT